MKLEIPIKPVIVKNSDFQTIIIRVMFPYVETDDNIAMLNILPNLLMFMNNKYKTEEEFQRNRKKNYILSTSCNTLVVGNTGCLCFSMVIPDKEALGFDNLEKQFEFFKELIYNPKLIDGGFDKFELDREKTNLNLSIDNRMKKLKSYQSIKALQLIDDEGILSRCIENNQEKINLINENNLYDFYKQIITEHQPSVFVFGNVNNDEINYLADKYLYNNEGGKTTINVEYNHFLKIRNTSTNYVEEESNFKDSSISLMYKVKDMKEDYFNHLSLLSSLLSSLSSRMLNKKLRDDNDLVYSSKVVPYMRFGVFEITAYINKKNKDLVIEKIKEVMDDIKNPDNIRKYLDNIKERRRILLIKCLDDKFCLLNDVVSETLKTSKNMKDEYDDILKITAEDISNFVDHLILDTVYFIKEEENE